MAGHHLSEIALALGVSPPAGPDRVISGVAGMEDAGPEQVTFLSDPAYVRHLADCRAGAVIMTRKLRRAGSPAGPRS